MMETEDMERILAAVRPLAKAAGKSESRDAIYAHFVQLVRENLHIVLCMSPIGDAFRVRCRMFPSLINCCTIDWFDEWPKDALLSVRALPQAGDGREVGGHRRHLRRHAGARGKMAASYVAEMGRHFYVTPTSYLS